MSDLRRRSYIGVYRGSVCVGELWRRSDFGVCRGGVSVSDPWRPTTLSSKNVITTKMSRKRVK